MKKIDRLMGIIYALKENNKLTAKEMADMFEVSERTIYRDIDVLSQLKVPVISYEGFNGGYEIDDKYFIPSVAFNENEILYLLICLKIGEIIKVPNMHNDYESLKYKLLNILEDDTKEHYTKMLERIVFNIDYITLGEYRNDIKDIVLQSFYEYRDIVIEYHRPRKNETFETRITPYVLAYSSGGWYIYGYCHLKKENRFFRIDRIKDIKLSEEIHEKAFVDNYFNGTDKENDYIEIVLEMEKNLYETMKNDRIFINSDKIECGNKVEIQLKTDEIHKIMEIATRNYQKVRIIEPKFLIDNLKEMSREILNKY